MSVYKHFPSYFEEKYFIQEWRHAIAILKSDYPTQFQEIVDVLSAFELRKSNMIAGGGGKSKISGYIDNQLYNLGWQEALTRILGWIRKKALTPLSLSTA